MNTDQLGAIAHDINQRLIRQGLSNAEISFVGMCLMSYAIAKTMSEMKEGK